MLDFFSLPADLFQLYMLSSVVTTRFATALAAMHGIVIFLLCAFAVMGQLRVRALLRITAISIGIAAAVGLGAVLTHVIDYEYSGEKDFVARTLVIEPVAMTTIEDLSQLSPVDGSGPPVLCFSQAKKTV